MLPLSASGKARGVVPEVCCQPGCQSQGLIIPKAAATLRAADTTRVGTTINAETVELAEQTGALGELASSVSRTNVLKGRINDEAYNCRPLPCRPLGQKYVSVRP
jgi:hypothetical protein